MTAQEKMSVCVLLGAAEVLVREATFPNSSFEPHREDFLREAEKFRNGN